MEVDEGWDLGGSQSRRSAENVGVVREIEEETAATAAEDKVHVAVAAEYKAGKGTLLWAIQNNPRDTNFVLVHVHVPAQMIPLMGGKFHVSLLSREKVSAYRQLEWDKTEKTLDEYVALCSRLKVRVEKLVIEKDDVAQGLIELVAEFGITKLVMGAAAEKRHPKKVKELKNKTAISVMQHAHASCRIWFVCKRNLVLTREASLFGSRIEQSLTVGSSFIPVQSEQLRSTFSPSLRNESLNLQYNPSQDHSHHSTFSLAERSNQDSGFVMAGSSITKWGEISRTSPRSDHLSASVTDEDLTNSQSISSPNAVDLEDRSVISSLVHGFEDNLQLQPLHHELEDSDSDANILATLQATLKEVESLKREAYEESCKRRKAEMRLILSHQKAKATENIYAKEVRYRKEIEEALDREKLEVEKLKNHQDEVLEQLQNAIEQKMELEHKLFESDRTSKGFQEECFDLQRERDDLVKEAEQRQRSKRTSVSYSWPFNTAFSCLELLQATQNFSDSLKIGEGGSGRVYRGFLRNTNVAIKVLDLQDQDEFLKVVAVLGRMRHVTHPNVVTLIGACFNALALIYEFLPNGSLEDRLACNNNSPPLSWKVRICIIVDICSALIFLHSNSPHPVVHGDLKPSSILLDANFVAKLGEFGISRFLAESNNTNAKETSIYIDPEFFTTGELTPQSDVYSFGIIILSLLTGNSAVGIVREVQEALDEGYLHAILDSSAGDWPFVQAKQLAHLGLRCSDKRRNRPHLAVEVWRVVEPMMKAASLPVSPRSLGSISDKNCSIPSYFICPIFQEIMTDPHMAADGFTYEAEAIRGWIDGGHDTSPMTNLRLSNCELIPNRALRSAIQEWYQQQQL